MDKKIKKLAYKKLIKYLLVIFIIAFSVLLLLFSKDVSQAIINSISSCLSIIIPSLFGFMVVSNILVKSNIYILISKPFYHISKYLFRIPPELFSIFLLGNIGGFPVGAKLISELLKESKISKQDASTLMCYSYCSGPAFIFGVIGINIFGNILVGLIIYLSIVISNFIIAIIIGFNNKIPDKKIEKKQIILNSNILIESIESTTKSLALICAMIVFFSAFITILDRINFLSIVSNYVNIIFNISPEHTKIFATSFLEISKISELSKYCYNVIPVITMLTSFGGMCVLMQIIGITNKQFSLKKFYISRPFQILLSAIISYYLVNKFAKNIIIMTIFVPLSNNQNKFSILPGICIIIMTILLLSNNLNSKSSKNNVQ